MATRADAEALKTYFVEHYRPGLTVDALKQWAGRVRAATLEMERDGKPVRYIRAAIVPVDESLLCELEAATEELVREAYARAGLTFERLSAVIPERAGEWATSADPPREEEQ